jgi:zinc/manganese transport system substrate-binding protein
VGQLEPKPGIEPSPTHVNALVPRMKQQKVRLILIETFRARRTPEYVANATGAKVVVLPASVGGHEKVKDYFDLFDYAVRQIDAALGWQ